MRLWRLAVIGLLLALPMAAVFAVATIALWRNGWLQWVWWTLPLCWSLAYLLSLRWRNLLQEHMTQRPKYWTPRDHEAWKLVESFQVDRDELSSKVLENPHEYLQAALDLGTRIARHYHPRAEDPLGSLTVNEILAAAQLALEDTGEWVERYVPGSHWMTVNQWRALAKTPVWLRRAGRVSWIATTIFQPQNLLRNLASRFAFGATSDQLRQNVLAWAYVVYLRSVGFYCIEMNSGRLRLGARRYRELQRQSELRLEPVTAADDEAPLSLAPVVKICVVGQVKAGKSSLINALLGARHAEVDVLPRTRDVQRYVLRDDPSLPSLELLDTRGYGEEPESRVREREFHEAWRNADAVLLVMHAGHPSRRDDVHMMEEMAEWFRERPELKPPPVLGVLTHMDVLRPPLEWEPPYNWQIPHSPKELSIAGCVQYTWEELAEHLAGVVPVCTDEGRVYGVAEWLVPSLLEVLDQSHGCALLRTLHAEQKQQQIRKLWGQLVRVGNEILKVRDRGGFFQPPT